MLRALLLLTLLVSQPVFAADCSTTTEEKIQQTVTEEHDKVIAVLDGDKLNLFLAALANNGYLVGKLEIDRIYIADAGKLPGYTSDNVWLFFIKDGCLLVAIPATKSIIMGLLP